jgi:hypothetical protein
MALNSATSVPGLIGRCSVGGARGDGRARIDDDQLQGGFFARAPRCGGEIGCAKAVFEPAMKIRSAWSMSS